MALGQMKWNGMQAVSTTYSGVEFDIVKSALQKYIRRGNVQKALLCAIEIYRFREVEGHAAVSNMYHRLAICAAEDIGCGKLSTVLEVIRIVQTGDRDLPTLLAMIHALCLCEKTRIMSQAWSAYTTRRNIAVAKGLHVDSEFSASDIEYITTHKEHPLFLASDPENIRAYVLVFFKRLQEKNYNAYTWAYFYLEATKTITLDKRSKFVQGNNRCTTGKPDILLWKALSYVLPPQTHDILAAAYFSYAEKGPFLQLATLSALHDEPYIEEDLTPVIGIWKNNPTVDEMLSGKFVLEVDDYAIDKHTRLGRQRGMGMEQFVNEGAVVIPQSQKYYNETLEEIFRAST